MYEQLVSAWMSTPVVTVPPSCTLAEAQRLMESRHIRRLPVVERGRLLGVVTWGDLRAAQPSAATTLSVYEWRALLERATVSECMTRDPLTIAPDATVLQAAQLMLERKIGGLPVLRDGLVVGMITESDLFRLLIGQHLDPVPADDRRRVLVCHHCGAELRGRFNADFGPGDQCWQCHYHLRRCDNCRFSDGIGCMLGRPERQDGVPGQHCPSFVYLASEKTERERG
ncbi:MAG: hypothetical protein OHK0022_58100 [Roseiflexaceae bacterium]